MKTTCAVAVVLGALLAACASVATDPFAGRYRSTSGADHDVMVVVPSSPSRWLLKLERIGRPSMAHPAGPLVEASAQQVAQWFGPDASRVRCLVASGVDPVPVLCSSPPGSMLRLRGAAAGPALTTGWLLLVPRQDGIEVTELVKG